MNRPLPQDYTMETGLMGAIGEGEALFLRINRNCPWNRCLFCHVYKGTNFSQRGLEEILADIDAGRRTKDLLENTSREMGLDGRMKESVIRETIQNHPEIYVEDVIYAMVGGDFALGNALKGLRRMYLDSKGEGKEGIDMEYDKNKIVYFVNSFVNRFGDK